MHISKNELWVLVFNKLIRVNSLENGKIVADKKDNRKKKILSYFFINDAN